MTDTLPRERVQQAADDRLALYDALLCLKSREEIDAFLAPDEEMMLMEMAHYVDEGYNDDLGGEY